MNRQMSSAPPPPPFVPPAGWRDAFIRAYTPALRENVLRFARGRVRMLVRAGGRVGEDDARDLVQAASADTALGVVTWDPAVKELEQHLIDVVKYRTRDEYLRLRRFPEVSLESASVARDAERQLAANARNHHREAVDADAALAELRALAADDANVLRLLDAFVQGVTKRADVMRALGWSLKTYNATRERIRYYTQRLAALDRETGGADV
jgi:hypothetical protein